MFFVILYCGAGLYLLLMAAGLLHRQFMKTVDSRRRLGIVIFGGGMFILGLYYAFHTYYFSTPEGKKFQEMQREMQRREGGRGRL